MSKKNKINNLISQVQTAGNTKNKNLDQIKTALKELILSSTVHSIPNIIRTKYSLIRIIWILFLALSTFLALVFIKNIFSGYLDYETVTKYKVFNERESDFPTITLCSRTSFNSTSLDDLIINCSFNGDSSCFWKKSAFFELHYDIGYGLCYRFNGANLNLKLVYSGIRFAFYLELNIRKYDEFIISIDNKTLIPYSLLNRETYVAPFTRSVFVVSRIFVENLPQPYNDCYKDLKKFDSNKTFLNMILNENRTYSQKECLELCGFNYYLDHNTCGCYPDIKNVEALCYLKAPNETVKNCTINFVGRHLKDLMTKICLDYCPLECDSLKYSIEKYSSSIKNSTIISVQLDDLNYTIISQEPKTYLFEMIANIGGVLGLFLGVSFLSSIEIIEIILEIVFILTKAK